MNRPIGIVKIAVTCVVVFSSVATAQQQEDVLEEIVVTAQKRGEQSLQDVPISITVLQGDLLDASSAEGINDLIWTVPGVSTFKTNQGNGSKFSIRGVTANPSLFSGSSTVAYYLDEVPFGLAKTPITPDANAYDLERVEVLKGPQGTLYGASALSGVIRILTKDADVNETEFHSRVNVSSTRNGGENYRGDAALNVPIIAGKLGLRASVGYQDLSGWIDRPDVDEQDHNDQAIVDYRLKLAAQPTDNFAFDLLAWFSRSDLDGLNTSFEDRTIPTVLDESTTTDYDVFGLTLSYDFQSITLESSTSYIDYVNDGLLDIAGIDQLQTLFEASTFTQEFRLYATNSGPWSWSTGFTYRDAEDFKLSSLPVVFPFPASEVIRSESIAGFGEVSRRLLDDKFELTLGLRYFRDEVSLDEESRLDEVPAEPIAAADVFERTTPRVVLSWFLNEKMTAYASYSQGFRSGFQQSGDILVAVPTAPPVKPDLLTNYEVGAKGSLGAIAYEVAVYYQDWEDPQQQLFIDIGSEEAQVGIAIPLNGEDANGAGFDLGLTATLESGLTIGASYSYNDLTFGEEVFSNGILIFEKGQRLDDSPASTGTLFAGYEFGVGSTGYIGAANFSVNYTSELQRVDAATGSVFKGDDIFASNLSLSLEAPVGWTARLFVDNVFDEDGVVAPSTSTRQYFASRLRPRTIGLQFEFNHD